jgi:signal transduction histidine kinase
VAFSVDALVSFFPFNNSCPTKLREPLRGDDNLHVSERAGTTVIVCCPIDGTAPRQRRVAQDEGRAQLKHSECSVGNASLQSLLRTTSGVVFAGLFVATLLVAVVFGSVVDSFTHTRDLDHTAMVVGDASKSALTLASDLYEADEAVTPVDLSASVARADREIRGSLADAARVKVPAVREAVEGSLAAWTAAEAQIEAAVRGGTPDTRQLNDLARNVLGRVQGAFVPVWQATSDEAVLRVASARRAKTRLQVGLVALLLGSAAILGRFHRRVRQGVVAPLTGLRAASERIGRGDFVAPVPMTGAAELLDVISAFNVMADGLTDRARLEAELRHAQKLESVGQLAAGIAHEINTPIQFVGDNVRFLEDAFSDLTRLVDAYGQADGSPEPEAARARARELAAEVDTTFLVAEVPQAITHTLEGVDRVATIVRAMKAFGHPSGEHKAPADLNEAVRNTLVVANNELKCVADVVTDLGDLPLVQCHVGDVNQVLLNLVVNAAQAVTEGVGGAGGRGTITVRTRHEGDEVVIEVVDNGVGIPPEIAERVFEPFFTTKEIGAGTGQGLALAHALVTDRHDGSIRFDSRPGSGTTFTVRLPVGAAFESSTPMERVA